MKVNRETVLSIICVVLSLMLLFFVVYGCRCTTEGFETEAKASPKPPVNTKAKPGVSGFSDKERELFDALMDNAIPDSQIQELIKSGVITDTLVGKFLHTLDVSKQQKADGSAKEKFKSAKAGFTAQAQKTADAEAKAKEHFANIEGFEANQLASFK